MKSKKHIDSLAIQLRTRTQFIIVSWFRGNISKAVKIDLSTATANQTEIKTCMGHFLYNVNSGIGDVLYTVFSDIAIA